MKIFMDYAVFVVAALLKPVTVFTNRLKNYNDIKIIGIFSAAVAGIAMLLNLIHQIILYVRVPILESTGFMRPPTVTGHEWYWGNLSELPWVNLIVRNFFIYLGIIVAIAAVYFLAGKIVRKDATTFQRTLAVATISAIPVILTSFILAPILGWLHVHLAVIIAVLALIYALAILISGMNHELDLQEDDLRLYVHVASIAVLLIVGYFIVMQMIEDAFSGLF